MASPNLTRRSLAQPISLPLPALPLTALLLALGTACLPESASSEDAALPPLTSDAGFDAAPPTGELRLRIEDHRGEPWPLTAAPRRPLLLLEAPRPWPEEPLDLLLVALGEPGTDEMAHRSQRLAEDLERAPLRQETLSWSVPLSRRDAAHPNLRSFGPIQPLRLGHRYALVLFPIPEDASGPLFDSQPWVELDVVAEDGGADLMDTWPATGTADVPPRLPHIALRFSDEVSALDRIVLEGPRGSVGLLAQPVECAELHWGDGHCINLALASPLQSHSRYTLHIPVLDRAGADLNERITFATGAQTSPIEPIAFPCHPGEQEALGGCLRSDDRSLSLRLRFADPVRGSIAGFRTSAQGTFPRGEVLLRLSHLAPNSEDFVVVALENLGGATWRERVVLRTNEPLPALAISEVRADPRGPEPAQEYIELWNHGSAALPLAGLRITDALDREGDVLPDASLAPGERALVVGRGFDPSDPRDTRIPEGVRLLRLESTLASGGLSNGGEPVYLFAGEQLLSAVPRLASAGPGLCLHRLGQTRSEHDEFSFAPCTPGGP